MVLYPIPTSQTQHKENLQPVPAQWELTFCPFSTRQFNGYTNNKRPRPPLANMDSDASMFCNVDGIPIPPLPPRTINNRGWREDHIADPSPFCPIVGSPRAPLPGLLAESSPRHSHPYDERSARHILQHPTPEDETERPRTINNRGQREGRIDDPLPFCPIVSSPRAPPPGLLAEPSPCYSHLYDERNAHYILQHLIPEDETAANLVLHEVLQSQGDHTTNGKQANNNSDALQDFLHFQNEPNDANDVLQQLLPDPYDTFVRSFMGEHSTNTLGLQVSLRDENAANSSHLPQPLDVVSSFALEGANTNTAEDVWESTALGIQAPSSEEAAIISILQQQLSPSHLQHLLEPLPLDVLPQPLPEARPIDLACPVATKYISSLITIDGANTNTSDALQAPLSDEAAAQLVFQILQPYLKNEQTQSTGIVDDVGDLTDAEDKLYKYIDWDF